MISSRRVKTFAAASVAGSSGSSSQLSFALVPAGGAAGGRHGLVDERDGGLGASSASARARADRLELAVVAAHGGGDDAAVQGRLAERVGLDREPHDDLLVGVEDVERERAGADAGDRRERAHLDRVGEAERLGQVVVEEARLGAACRSWPAPRPSRGRAARAGRRRGGPSGPRRTRGRRRCRRTWRWRRGCGPRAGPGARTARRARRPDRTLRAGDGRAFARQSRTRIVRVRLTAILTPDPLSGRPRRPPSRGQRGSMSSGTMQSCSSPSRRACGGVETASPALCGGPRT